MKSLNYLQKFWLTPSVVFAGTLALLSSINTAVVAQINPEARGDYQRNEQNSRSTIEGFDPMQLIHNANLRRSRGGAEFMEDTNNQLNQAAEEFRRLQQQRLQEAEAADEVVPEN